MVTADEVLKQAEEQRVRFVALWFTDITGLVKSIMIPARELGNVLDNIIILWLAAVVTSLAISIFLMTLSSLWVARCCRHWRIWAFMSIRRIPKSAAVSMRLTSSMTMRCVRLTMF